MLDDRIGKQADDLWAVLGDEIDYVENFESTLWIRLASAIDLENS